MPTETLHYENARLAQQLFANDPQNLAALEPALSVKATSRDGWIKLDGEAAAIERAKHLFQLIEASVRAGTPVRTRDFAQSLSVVQHEGAGALRELQAERINTSPRKPQVTPKTTGQRRYVEAIRAHVDLWRRSRRHGQDVSRHGDGSGGTARGKSFTHHPHAPGGGGG